MNGDRFFYANGAEVAISPYDVTFKFLRNGSGAAQIGDMPKPGTQEAQSVVQDTLSVSMSLSHLKAMTTGVLQMIGDYEAKYGEIPMTEEAKGHWRAVASALAKSST